MKTGARKKTKKNTTEEAYFARFEHEIFNSNHTKKEERPKVTHMRPKIQRPNKPMLEHKPMGEYHLEPKTNTIFVLRSTVKKEVTNA